MTCSPSGPTEPAVQPRDPPPVEESVARGIVAAHRARLEWLLRIPEFEPLLASALVALKLPGQRQGISLRAATMALALESKHDVVRHVVSAFRLHLSSAVAVGICRAAGIERFDQHELDAHLTQRQWSRLREKLLFRLSQEHRKYKHAQQLLFCLHRGLIDALVVRVVFSSGHRADCAQEGALALLQAIDRADATGGDLRAYAATWVKRAIRNFLMRQRLPVYAPLNLISEATRGETARGNALPASLTGGTSAVGDHHKLVALLHDCLRHPSVSFDDIPFGGPQPLREMVEDLDQENPAEAALRTDLCVAVQTAMSGLTHKQRDVLCLRYGIGGGPAGSLEEIARVAGISRQQAGMRAKRALRRVEEALSPLRAEFAAVI